MKRAVTMSVMLISLAALLVGLGTFAYFSDSASSTGNTFTAGNMLFNIKDPGSSGHTMFAVTNMKPGGVSASCIAVVNDSSLDMGMKWHAWISDGTPNDLGPALEAKVTLNPGAGSGCDSAYASIAGYLNAGTSGEVITDWTSFASLGAGNTVLQWVHPGGYDFMPNWGSVYKLEVRIKSTAGNEFQGTSYVGNLNFYATQANNPGW